MYTCSLALLVVMSLALCCSQAAVKPVEGKLAVSVEAGDYTVRARVVHVSVTTELSIDPPEMVTVRGEEHVLTDEQPQAYQLGTSLLATLGPVDRFTRLPYAIAPETVVLRSEPDGGVTYNEGADYVLDHTWGGMARTESSAIPAGARVFADYQVYLQRVDLVQASCDGSVTLKKGASAPVCAKIPEPDEGCTALATVYVPYRTTAVTGDNILRAPSTDLTWRDFIRTSGRDRLAKTLGLLAAGKPVRVVCWGDSVTQGGSPSSHDKCYVELFRSRLSAAYPKADITLINAGIGGSNTDSRRDGYDKEVLALNPDLITVEYVNDTGKSAEHIRSNYAEFVARARANNPEVEFIILTPHFVMPAWISCFATSVPAMRQAAEDSAVALGDTTNIWANLRQVCIPYETLLANAINHPDDLGHEFFAATLMDLLAPAD